MQKIGGTLGMRGGAEDRTLVVFEHLQPALNIGGVIGAGFGGQGQIDTQKCCAKFGNQFLAGIAFITPFLAAKVAIKAALVFRPVGQLVSQRGIIGLGAAEALKMGHLHMIRPAAVVGGIPAVANVCACDCEELVCMFDPLRGVDDRFRISIEMLGQTFDLLDVEHAIAFHERDFALFLAAVVLLFRLGDGVRIDNNVAR